MDRGIDILAIQGAHPEWDVVDAIYAPNGGIWAVGADGGVFSLNATGGTQGELAPFLGSYWSDFLAPARNDPSRRFEGIEATPAGYRLLSTNPAEAGYDFGYGVNLPLPTAPVAAPTDLVDAAPKDVNPADQSGRATFVETMIDVGFTPAAAESLATTLWTPSKIKSADELMGDLRKTPEYTARFGGLVTLRDRAAKGEYIPYIPSEKEYVTTEAGYAKAARDAGLPAKFYDSPDDFSALIGGGVSPTEYASRIQMGQQAALGTDPALRQELAAAFPDLTMGDLTAFFLDPTKGTEVLQTKFAQSQIGAASRRSGFGILTQAEKETLQGRGLTLERATAGLAEVAAATPLEKELAGETMTGSKITRKQQLGLATGEGADVATFERRRQSRRAVFEGGGGAAQGGAGTSGLGSAK